MEVSASPQAGAWQPAPPGLPHGRLWKCQAPRGSRPTPPGFPGLPRSLAGFFLGNSTQRWSPQSTHTLLGPPEARSPVTWLGTPRGSSPVASPARPTPGPPSLVATTRHHASRGTGLLLPSSSPHPETRQAVASSSSVLFYQNSKTPKRKLRASLFTIQAIGKPS